MSAKTYSTPTGTCQGWGQLQDYITITITCKNKVCNYYYIYYGALYLYYYYYYSYNVI